MFGSKKIYIFVFFIFFLFRAWGIHFGLPCDGIHPTENFSIWQSLQYLSTGNLKPADFQHPALFQYLISLISFLTFLPARNYLYFYLLGRVISCLASFFSVFFLYLLAKRLLNSRAFGLFCASFLGLNLLSIKYAHYAVPDSLSLFFIVLSLFYTLEILRQPSLKNYLLCGLFCGLSVGSKFSGLISLGFLSCAHLSFFKDKKPLSHQKCALGLLTAFIAFFLVSPCHILFFKAATADFGNYLFEKGYFAVSGLKASGFFTYPFMLLPGTFGFLGLLFSLAGLCLMFLQERKKALVLFIPVCIYYLIIGSEKGGTLQNLLPVLPAFGIFAAYFFSRLKTKKINRALVIILAVLILLPLLAKAVVFDYFLLQPDTRVLAQDWLIKNIEKNALIGFEKYTPFDLNYLATPPVAKKFSAVYFMPSLSLYPASFYKEQGYDYIVTSSFRRDSYQFFCRKTGACLELENYRTYDAELKLLATFATPQILRLSADASPWTTWPHQPTVRIYKVKGN